MRPHRIVASIAKFRVSKEKVFMGCLMLLLLLAGASCGLVLMKPSKVRLPYSRNMMLLAPRLSHDAHLIPNEIHFMLLAWGRFLTRPTNSDVSKGGRKQRN